VKAGLALDGGVLFAVSSDGYLVLLNAADGKPIERHPINHPAKPGKGGYSLSTPTVAGGKVFVGSETGGMRCFEVIGGK
jgi:outer membrane protein assembly factor BamB